MDGNKTALTHRITATAAAYLAGAGCKPVETEVPVAESWVADVASFIYPTRTEAKKLKLTGRVISKETQQTIDYYEMLHHYGIPLTAIVEVKISKCDFIKDLNRKFNGRFPAHLCYLAYPTGLLSNEERPKGWIGLQVSKDGQSIVRVHTAGIVNPHPQHPGVVIDLIAAVAIRRDHRTRYAVMRDWLKAYKAEEKGRIRQSNLSLMISAMAEWLNQEGFYKHYSTLVDVYEAVVKWKPPKYLIEQLEKLQSLRASVNSVVEKREVKDES